MNTNLQTMEIKFGIGLDGGQQEELFCGQKEFIIEKV